MNKTFIFLTALISLSIAQAMPPAAPVTPAAPAKAPASMTDSFMQHLDTDKNGQVSKSEFLKPQEAQFAHIDKNSDGQLQRAEVDTFAQQMQQRMQQMRSQQRPQ